MVNHHHPGLRGDSALRHTITPPLSTSLEGASDAHELANAVGARIYNQYKDLRASAGKGGKGYGKS